MRVDDVSRVEDEGSSEAEHALGDAGDWPILADGGEFGDVADVIPPLTRGEIGRGEVHLVGFEIPDLAEAGRLVEVEGWGFVDEGAVSRHAGVEFEKLGELLVVADADEGEGDALGVELGDGVDPRVGVGPAVGSAEVAEHDEDRLARAHRLAEVDEVAGGGHDGDRAEGRGVHRLAVHRRGANDAGVELALGERAGRGGGGAGDERDAGRAGRAERRRAEGLRTEGGREGRRRG